MAIHGEPWELTGSHLCLEGNDWESFLLDGMTGESLSGGVIRACDTGPIWPYLKTLTSY